MTPLIYYVAIGEKYCALADKSLHTLRLSGYAGSVLLVTDGPSWPTEATEAVWAASEGVFAAKRLRAATLLSRGGLSRYDAILYLDSDTLITQDPTPLLEKIANNPDKIICTTTK